MKKTMLGMPILLVRCWGFALGLFLLWGAVCAAWDGIGYATGRLHTQEITLADTALYELVEMERTGDDTLVSQGGDAYLLLKPGQQARTVRLAARFSMDGTEKDLYYHLPGIGFTPRLRVWPTRTATGYTYVLPPVTGLNIRLDLFDSSGVTAEVEKIVLNEPIPLWRYFVPTLWQSIWILALPGLFYCLLALAGDAIKHKKVGNDT